MTVPVLEIKTCQITIPISAGTKVLVEKDDLVSEGKLLACSEENFQEVNLTKILKVSPQDVSKFLLVAPGAKIKEGDVLAQKKSLLANIIFQSTVSGIFAELLPEGFLRIRVSEQKEIKSPVRGKVVEIKEGKSVTLEFDATIISAEAGEGGENWGEIEILGKQEEIKLEDLPSSPKGKILVIRGEVPSGFIHKAEALEALGIVAAAPSGRVKTTDLALLIIADKDGQMPIEVWETIKKSVGRLALVSGREKTLKIPLG